MSSQHRITLATFLILCLLLSVCCIYVNATASSCRAPETSKSSSKRRAVVLENDNPSSEQQLISSTTTNKPAESSSSQPTTTATTSNYPISPEAKYYIDKQPTTFHITGPLDLKLSKRSETFRGSDKIKCVACRMDCMKKVHPEIGSFFESCRDQFYYYGCQKKQPCYEAVDGDFVLEMAIGICLEKNGCIMKKAFLSNGNADSSSQSDGQ
ncbi:predicted protein [Naegleria gruberi]|uniref:Predicted protein n=1 Tax=Naegleria gruberi TaxID=5762 RepID=D2VHK1_NAEGR|nr:uncharacterized protein NAEGRDRAFT_68354 [Naegleria gruberi]EFC43603.1 predicted protein [Naegleria gruberi]|eukprot:XP_002676347.1 predicted protein [Naegleria gruberi strain NEG-M]